jgi:hypothetical protein
MTSLHPSASRLEAGLRWTARLLAAALVALVLVIFVGEGFNPLNLKPTETIQMTFFLTTCVGMVLVWRWPVLGGVLAMAGILCFFVGEVILTGGFPKGLVFYLMLLTGLLLLLSGVLGRRRIAR